MNQPAETPGRPSPDDDRPPFLGSWSRVYAAVLAWLAALVVFFWIFTIAFS